MTDCVGLFMDEDGDIGELSFELLGDCNPISESSEITHARWKAFEKSIADIDALDALFNALSPRSQHNKIEEYERQLNLIYELSPN
jgi:hypothetical protein